MGVLKGVRAFLVWYFHASLPVQTDATLEELAKDLAAFNKTKNVFIEASLSKFQFPKIHSMQHCADQIKKYGTLDNYDSEYGEHQHITDAKVPYRRSNKRDAKAQMIKHIQRRTALETKLDYLVAQKAVDQSQNAPRNKQQGMRSRVPGMLSIRDTSSTFNLRGNFELATKKYFDLERKLGVSVPDITCLEVSIHQSYTVHCIDSYWKNDHDTIKDIVRCNRRFYGRPRFDWVVVWNLDKLEKAHKNGIELYGMDQYKIAQLQLLFVINQNEYKRHLAYVEWFDIGLPDTETQMPIVTRSGKFHVIDTNAIIRNIHLLPFFQNWNSARTARETWKDVYSFKKYLVNPYSDMEA